MARRDKMSNAVRDDLARTASLTRDGRKLPPVVDGFLTLPNLILTYGADWIRSPAARGTPHWRPDGCARCSNHVFVLGSAWCPRCAPAAVCGELLKPVRVELIADDGAADTGETQEAAPTKEAAE